MLGFITESHFRAIAEVYGEHIAVACATCGQGYTFLDFLVICGIIG